MTAPALDYFAREAADCLARLRAWRQPGGDAGDARAAARALRGAAAMAGHPEFAALGAAFERATLAPAGADGLLGAAADEALAAGEAALGAPGAPGGLGALGERAAERLRATAAVLASAADALGAHASAPNGDGGPDAAEADLSGVIVPIRSLARDGDAEFVVYRASAPPATADRRFRDASAPLAAALRRLVAEARAAAPSGAPDPAVARTLGADLQAAVTDLRELAEGYDVAPAARFFAGRSAGAAALDPRSLAALDAAAAGLLGERAPGGPERPAAAPAPEPGDAFRPPTGEALVALLETGITGLETIDTTEILDPPVAEAAAPPAEPPAVPAPHRATPPQPALPNGAARGGAPPAAADPRTAAPNGVVAIADLLYRGPAALARAREVRDALRGRPGPPDPTLLDELYDLLDLAAE